MDSASWRSPGCRAAPYTPLCADLNAMISSALSGNDSPLPTRSNAHLVSTTSSPQPGELPSMLLANAILCSRDSCRLKRLALYEISFQCRLLCSAADHAAYRILSCSGHRTAGMEFRVV